MIKSKKHVKITASFIDSGDCLFRMAAKVPVDDSADVAELMGGVALTLNKVIEESLGLEELEENKKEKFLLKPPKKKK